MLSEKNIAEENAKSDIIFEIWWTIFRSNCFWKIHMAYAQRIWWY